METKGFNSSSMHKLHEIVSYQVLQDNTGDSVISEAKPVIDYKEEDENESNLIKI